MDSKSGHRFAPLFGDRPQPSGRDVVRDRDRDDVCRRHAAPRAGAALGATP